MAAEYKVSVHSLSQKRSSRSTVNHRNVFMKAFMKGRQERKEKHEILLLQARSMFVDASRDCPGKLSSLVQSVFPLLEGFDVDWTSSVLEANTLATMCCRGNARPKCLKLLLEKFSANVELGDVGGFNPLILSAFHGNLTCVIYCVKRGANLLAIGRERSGLYLIAEQWASIRGHKLVAKYLRETRRKLQSTLLAMSRSTCEVYSSSETKLPSPPPRANNHTTPSKAMSPALQFQVLQTNETNDFIMLGDYPSEALLTPIGEVHFPVNDKTDNRPEHYCVCSRGNIGNMVLCGGQDCPYAWFHYSCVGITEDLTDSESWLCPFCDETDGYFPEPKLTVFSAFLNNPLPPLNVNSPTTFMKCNAREKARSRGKTDRTPTPRKNVRKVSPSSTDMACVTPTPIRATPST